MSSRTSHAATAPLVEQLMRFGLAGAILATLTTVTYAVPAALLGVQPLLATLFSYCVAVAAGFFLHSRLSFAGHGGRDRPARRGARFLAVSLVGLMLNSFFVWILTGPVRLPPLWPIIPMLCVTPFVSFWLQRHWVFR